MRNVIFQIGHVQTMFKDYSAKKQYLRANVSQKMFPSLPTGET